MARPFKQQRDPQKTPRKPAPVALDENGLLEAQPAQRLHKLLALAGLGSRRDMEILIASGRVTINGQVATVGAAVTEFDVVRLDSRPIRLPFEPELPQVLLYHKPEGEIVSQDDPEGRATVFDKLPRIKQGKWIAIGRLDMNTSGLLIFTNSGELANRFMHPRYEVEREYAVRVFGELSEEQMALLTQGIELEDGPASFDRIIPQGGEGANHWYQVVIREGRNREVRRLFEAFQLPVSRLMRVRFGPVNLPSRVKRGTMLKLEQKQVIELLEWAGMPVPRGPLKQLSQREKDKATSVFVPKVRKQRGSVLKRSPRDASSNASDIEHKAAKTPSHKKTSVKRRIRDGNDLAAPTQQKRSDRNRGRG
ncbi:MAG TPA: pseudouridine synthase [Methylophilaceae bacterium]|nr:pseudouridine synthase [Methylophilaceae bacterium]